MDVMAGNVEAAGVPTPGAPAHGGFKRETAHRVFAAEFNASDMTIEGQGEMEPSYLVTPLGGRLNRVHIVGVCTDVEQVGEAGDVLRARISDPTGVYMVYAGQYQPEAAQALSDLEVPSFVAVTGKARTFEPEDGKLFCSIRPEVVSVVDRETRDAWILDAAKCTLARADDVDAMDPATVPAQEHYGPGQTLRFRDVTRDALGALVGGDVPVHHVGPEDLGDDLGRGDVEAPAWTPNTPAASSPASPVTATDPAAEAAEQELDDQVLAVVQKLEGDKGAQWDDILQEAAQGTVSDNDVDEALNRLMDKGLVYEPTLGVLRST